MRDAMFLVCIVTTAIILPIMASDKDGFNFYKDYLRGRSEEGVPEEPPISERSYFRTPMALYPGLLPAEVEQEYKKRTNAFKNHMLSKETGTETDIRGKRSRTVLSYLMKKHPNHYSQLMDDLESSLEKSLNG